VAGSELSRCQSNSLVEKGFWRVLATYPRPEVQARLKELQEQHAARCAVSKESLTQKLQLAYDRGMELNQVSAAVAAAREIAVLHGMRVEKQEVGPSGSFEALDDGDYVQKIMQRIQLALSWATARPPSDPEQ
jgi:hypothetical protein